MGALQLLGEALGVAGRNEDAVDAVVDDVAVAGNRRGNRRRACGKSLGQDHAKALARKRWGTEHICFMHRGVKGLTGDAPAHVDVAHRLRVGEVAQYVLALGTDHGEAAGYVLDQSAKGGKQNWQALALLRPADEEDAQLLARRLRPARRGGDIDPVGDHLVMAAVPAPPGPGGRLGDGDPGREAIEHTPRSQAGGEVVGRGLGRVGVEGANGRGVGSQRRVPADQRYQRLVDVDDVEIAPAQLTAWGDDSAGREGRQIRDRSV